MDSNFSTKYAVLCTKKWKLTFCSLGITLVVIGIIGFILLPGLIEIMVHKNLALAEGKETYDKWKNTPIPVTFTVNLFNVTNPVEVLKGEKPIVAEVGPYVFRQYRSKDVLSWDDEDMTVTYNDLKQYHFVKELSADMNNKIYNINLPLQGIIMFLRKLTLRSFIIPILEGILQNYEEHVFFHRTARELLFDGYKVNLIEDLNELASAFVTVPKLLPDNTFGFLYGKNNSGDGVFTVYTGVDDLSKYSQIVTWNNMSRIPFWNNEFCNMMNGTDGAQFPPPITRRDILHVYTPELCRSVSLAYEKDVNVKSIPALRFTTPEWLFASPTVNPDNMCYCTEPELCELSGILDVSPCRHGLKLAITAPHFFLAHKFIQDKVDGLYPDRSQHETYVDIEPMTGIVLRASRKLQMNFFLNKFEDMEDMKNLPIAALPLLWVTEEAEIDDKNAALFTNKVRTPITIAKSVLTTCIVLGLLWIACVGFITIYVLIRQQQHAKAIVKNKYKAVPLRSEAILKS